MKLSRFIKITFGILIGYVVLFFVANAFFKFVFPIKVNDLRSLVAQDAWGILPTFMISFILFFAIVIYLFNSWLERKWVRIKWPDIVLFMGITAALGPTSEILINTVARAFLGEPLWIYQFLPVHGGDTSIFTSIIWPLYGFHIYCFHAALKARYDKTEDVDLALFIGIDAITLEVLANLFSLSLFYTYIFYYFAGDLRHLSTAVIFIPYVLFGYFAIKILHFLEKDHHRVFWGIIGFIWNWFIIFAF
ncbi:MAG: hypothetical protein Q8Q17_01110 [bacterium]|nr:hypothetical protein [bacterium]